MLACEQLQGLSIFVHMHKTEPPANAAKAGVKKLSADFLFSILQEINCYRRYPTGEHLRSVTGRTLNFTFGNE
jgi:hypothetical protein